MLYMGLILLVTFFWGVTFPLIKIALEYISPVVFLALRFSSVTNVPAWTVMVVFVITLVELMPLKTAGSSPALTSPGNVSSTPSSSTPLWGFNGVRDKNFSVTFTSNYTVILTVYNLSGDPTLYWTYSPSAVLQGLRSNNNLWHLRLPCIH